MDRKYSCCFTGYRPSKFSFSLNSDSDEYRRMIKRLITSISEELINGCTRFYCGLAMGFDIIAGEHVSLMKQLNIHIELIGVSPYTGQDSRYPAEWKQRYWDLVAACNDVITLNDKYCSTAFAQRNRYMVDRCETVITYFDGKSGGTKNTIGYAYRKGRKVVNLFESDPIHPFMEHFGNIIRIEPPE